jgi:hypothetical protein
MSETRPYKVIIGTTGLHIPRPVELLVTATSRSQAIRAAIVREIGVECKAASASDVIRLLQSGTRHVVAEDVLLEPEDDAQPAQVVVPGNG